MLAGGCQSMTPEWKPEPIEASQSMIRFDHPKLDPRWAKYTVQCDPRSGNTVYLARLIGPKTFAVLAALKSGPSFVVGNRSAESYVADLFEDAELDWGEEGRAASAMGAVPYRMFRLVSSAASCAGFAQQVGQPADDTNHRKDVVFGYFCQAEAGPMAPAVAEDLIGKVSIARPG